MEITGWRLKNYRSVKSGGYRLSDFTALIGKNNSGKSNVLNSIDDYRHLLTNQSTHITERVFQRVATRVEDDRPVGFHVEFTLSEQEHEQLMTSLVENEAFNSDFSTICIIDEHLKSWRHEITFDRERILENKIETILHNEIVTISERVGKDDRRDGSEYRVLNFSQLPEGIGHTSTHKGGDLPQTAFDVGPAKLWNIHKQFLEGVEKIMAFRIPADTRPVSLEEDLSPDAGNLPSILNSLSQNRKSEFRQIVDIYKSIMEGITDIRTPLLANTASASAETTVEIDEEGMSEGFPLEDISSGSKEILALITKVVLAKNETSLLLVEEPELHLHPAAEQHIFDLIHETALGEGPQVIVSTHSDVFVDQSEVDNIIFVKRDLFTTLNNVSGEEITEELANLGYDTSDFVQSDVVVFVEGRSDKVILERFSETLSTPFDKIGVSAIVLNGDNLYADSEPVMEVLDQIGIPYIFVLDSDGEEPEKKRMAVSSEISTSPENIHVLHKYSIESYLIDVPHAVAQAVGEDEDTIKEFLDERTGGGNMKWVLDELFSEFLGTGFHPEKHGAAIAKQMDEDQLDDELRELLEYITSLSG